MGKKYLVIVEFDAETGETDARYYGMPSRAGAIQVFRRLFRDLNRTVARGFTPREFMEVEPDEAQTATFTTPENIEETENEKNEEIEQFEEETDE